MQVPVPISYFLWGVTWYMYSLVPRPQHATSKSWLWPEDEANTWHLLQLQGSKSLAWTQRHHKSFRRFYKSTCLKSCRPNDFGTQLQGSYLPPTYHMHVAYCMAWILSTMVYIIPESARLHTTHTDALIQWSRITIPRYLWITTCAEFSYLMDNSSR